MADRNLEIASEEMRRDLINSIELFEVHYNIINAESIHSTGTRCQNG